MKKIILTLVFALAATFAVAQDYSGKWFIEGNFYYYNTNDNDSNYDKDRSTLLIRPTIGKYINSNTVVGFGLIYSYDIEKRFYHNNSNETLSISNNWGIAPMFKKYWAITKNKRVSAFGEAVLPIVYRHFNNSDAVQYSANLSLAPGLSCKLSDKVSLEASYKLANLSYTFINDGSGNISRSFGINSNTNESLTNLNIGVKFIL